MLYQGPWRGRGTFWLVNKTFYFILLNHIHHLQKQLTLYFIKYIKVFSDKPNNFRQFVISFAAERTHHEIMEFQLLFLFSFVLGLVCHKDKVSSLSKFEAVFAQRCYF